MGKVNPFPNELWYLCVCSLSFANTVGKGEIGGNDQFFRFPVFSTLSENFLPFSSNLKLSSADSFSLKDSKIVVWEKVISFPNEKF